MGGGGRVGWPWVGFCAWLVSLTATLLKCCIHPLHCTPVGGMPSLRVQFTRSVHTYPYCRCLLQAAALAASSLHPKRRHSA